MNEPGADLCQRIFAEDLYQLTRNPEVAATPEYVPPSLARSFMFPNCTPV